jgi:hypothetical protein
MGIVTALNFHCADSALKIMRITMMGLMQNVERYARFESCRMFNEVIPTLLPLLAEAPLLGEPLIELRV